MTDRELNIKKAMADCRHFTGIHRDVCKAGVTYRTLVGGPDLGWARRIPCIVGGFAPDGKFPIVPCDKHEGMTREEAEQHVNAMEAAFERFWKVHRAAKEHAKGQGFGRGHAGHGELPCPACEGGTLRYTVAGVNGHMHAACSTEGCASWME